MIEKDKIKRFLIIIFFISFGLRTIYMLVPQTNYFREILPVKFYSYEQTSDDKTYTTLAKGILENGYPSENGNFSMYAGFLYPYIVSINLMFSDNYIYIFFFQIFLDSLTACLIFLIVSKILNKPLVSLISGLLYAIYYPNFIFPARILTECFFTFVLMLAFYFILLAFQTKNIKYLFLFASLISICALTKAMIFYVFLVLYIYIVYLSLRKKIFSPKVILIIFAFILFQLPYYYFSYVNSGRLIVGSSNGWYIVLTGTYLPLQGDELKDDDFVKYPEHPVGKVYKMSDENNWNEFQRDSAFKSLAKEQLINNFTHHPFKSLQVMGIQLSRFWFHMPYYIRFNPRYGTIVQAIFKFILTIIMLIGIYFSVFKIKDEYLKFCLMFLIFYSGFHSIVFSFYRYSAPLVPIMMIFVGMGITYFIQRKNIKV